MLLPNYFLQYEKQLTNKSLSSWPGNCYRRLTCETLPSTNLKSGGEFHHLVGLDVLKTVDASNTVTDAEHSAGFFEVGFGGGAHDALLKDRRDLGSTTAARDVELAARNLRRRP
jgi:hypothetical protein